MGEGESCVSYLSYAIVKRFRDSLRRRQVSGDERHHQGCMVSASHKLTVCTRTFCFFVFLFASSEGTKRFPRLVSLLHLSMSLLVELAQAILHNKRAYLYLYFYKVTCLQYVCCARRDTGKKSLYYNCSLVQTIFAITFCICALSISKQLKLLLFARHK
jgi:hypothetical protein